MRILLFTLAITLLTSAAQAKTLSFTPSTVYQMDAALKDLKSGDKVVFQRGTYELNNGLRVQGLSNVSFEGRGRVEIVVKDLNDAVLGFDDCKDIQVKGLWLRHKTPAPEYQCEGAVVRLNRCQRVFIAENRLNGCGAAGVYAMSSKDVVIYKNRIFNNSFAAIWFADVSATVHGNRVYDNASSFISYGKCDVSFTENEIEGNSGNIFNNTTFFHQMTGLKG